MMVRRSLLVPGVIFAMLIGLCVVGLVYPLLAGNCYVDHTKTGGGETGADTTNAYLTLGAAVTAARSAGDSVFVRATHKDTLSADVNVLSDGTPLAPIVVWGDDGSTWPLVHADSIATITTQTYELKWSDDDYWHIHRMKLNGHDSATGAIYVAKARMLITNCQSERGVGNGDALIYASAGGRVIMRDCTLDGNTIGVAGTDAGCGLVSAGGYIEAWNCSFDDLLRGIYSAGGNITAYNCDFGVSQTNTTDVLMYGGEVSLVSCTLANPVYDNATNCWNNGVVEYGLDANKRVDWLFDAEVREMETNYTTLHSGGGAYSLAAKFNAAAATGPTAPWYLAEYAVYADSAETRTYTMYAYRDAAWTPKPSATELRLEVIAWGPSSDSLLITSSTETLVDSLAWYSLTAEVTPNHDGTVFVRLVCEDYDADGVLYIDPKLTATGETYHEMFAPLGPDLAYLYTAPAAGGSWGRVIIIN